MIHIINQYFDRTTSIANIRSILCSKAADKTIGNEQIKPLDLIANILDLSLIESNNKTTYINDYKPGSEVLECIVEIVEKVDNIILQGYFYDVLQVNQRNKFINAKKAISAYFEISDFQNTISEKRKYYIRILQILQSLGKGNKSLIPDNVPRIFNELIDGNIETDSYSITKIAEKIIPLQTDDCIDWCQYTSKIKNGVKSFKEACKFEQYRQCNHVLALLLKEDQLEYGQNVARSYFWEASEYVKTPDISQHLIVDLYEKGLRLFERLQVTSVEVDERKLELIEIKRKAAKQLADFGIKTTRALEKQSIQMPNGLNTIQAVYWLISPPIRSKSSSEEAWNQKKKSFIYTNLNSVIQDSQGNTIDKSPDNEKNVYRIAKELRDDYCYSVLQPAYEEFLKNFTISEVEVYDLISSSKFIPSDRLDLYAHALYHGFCGNFAVAVYILIPQIENGIRYVLESNSIITRKYTQEQQNTMSLESYFEKLNELINEDLLFDLRVLLNEGFGDNMRHDIAHGIYPTSKIFSEPGFYLWWISLKLAIDFDNFRIKI